MSGTEDLARISKRYGAAHGLESIIVVAIDIGHDIVLGRLGRLGRLGLGAALLRKVLLDSLDSSGGVSSDSARGREAIFL